MNESNIDYREYGYTPHEWHREKVLEEIEVELEDLNRRVGINDMVSYLNKLRNKYGIEKVYEDALIQLHIFMRKANEKADDILLYADDPEDFRGWLIDIAIECGALIWHFEMIEDNDIETYSKLKDAIADTVNNSVLYQKAKTIRRRSEA